MSSHGITAAVDASDVDALEHKLQLLPSTKVAAAAELAGATGHAALCLAAGHGRAALVRAIIALVGPPPLTSDATPLHVAAQGGHHECVSTLIDARANVNAVDADGAVPLHLACAVGEERCVEYLVKGGADVMVPDSDGQTSIFIAALAGHAPILRILCAVKGADVNRPNADGMTPLFRACEDARVVSVRVLLEARADSNLSETKQLRTPAFVAAQFENYSCLECLIAHANPDLHLANRNKRTPLQVARKLQHHQSASILALATLEYREDENISPRPDRRSSLMRRGPPPIAKLVNNKQELQATVRGEKVAICLPYAFARRPLDTAYAVIGLVSAYRKKADGITKTDERGGEELLDAAFRVQQALMAMVDTLDDVEFARLLLPNSGDTSLIEAALISQCKLLLAYPRLQRLLNERWSFASPLDVHSFAAVYWYRQDAPGYMEEALGASTGYHDNKDELSSATRLVAPPTMLHLYRQTAITVLRNMLMLTAEAFWPPLAASIAQEILTAKRAARACVEQRNPEPSDYDASGAKVYLLDGVVVSQALKRRTSEDQAAKRSKWERKRATLAQKESRLAEFDYHLFQPCGTFILHAISKVIFAILVTALGPVGDCSHRYIGLLMLWNLEMLWRNIEAATTKTGLWLTDIFNVFELIAGFLIAAGLGVRIDIVWTATATDASSTLIIRAESMPYIHLGQALLAAGICAMWIAQWCQLLQASATFGPLVLMALEMVKDCARFLVLLSGIFFAFGVALVTLLRPVNLGTPSGEQLDLWAVDGYDTHCAFLFSSGGGFTPMWKASISLLQMVLGTTTDIEKCLPGHSMAPLVLDTFRALVIVMALNMLIAQMATTYERIRERLATNFMFLNALLITNAMNEPGVPAPFGVFGLPFYIGLLFARIASIVPACSAPVSRLGSYLHLDETGNLDDGSSASHPHMMMSQMSEGMLRANENVLRAAIERRLDEGSGEAGANDDRWKARQSRQLGMIGQSVHELTKRVGGLETLETHLSRRMLEHLDHMAHDWQHRSEDLAEQRTLLQQIDAGFDAGVSA